MSRQQNLPTQPQGDDHFIHREPQQCPNQAELSFPYLDTLNELSSDKKKDLIQTLSNDHRMIVKKFATLEAHICESIKRQNISAEVITNSILSLALVKSDDVPRALLIDEVESFEETTSIDRVFLLLKKHKLISYFDHGILRHIIEIHGTEDDMRELKEYLDEFQEFCRRKVFEVPPVISECTSATRKIFKVLITEHMSANLIDVAAAERKIADILGLPHSALTLHKITPGSLVLTLSIPLLIADKIFPLRAS